MLIFSTSSVGRLWHCSCLWQFLYLGPFGSIGSFLLSYISGMCAPCRHLFISSASLSLIEVNQKPCIPSWPGVFQFDIFSVVLSKLSDLLRALLILLSYCLSTWLFRCFLVAIFWPKIVQFFLLLAIGLLSSHFLPAVGRIFFFFFFFNIFHFFFARTFWFISSSFIVIFSCIAISFLYLHVPASFLCFIILECFRRFLSTFPVEFPTLVLIFYSFFLWGSQFSQKTISPLHRFVHLIQLYYSLNVR